MAFSEALHLAGQLDAIYHSDESMKDNLTPFVQIGGASAVSALVDRFYDNMETLPEARGIRAIHAPNLAPMRETLKK